MKLARFRCKKILINECITEYLMLSAIFIAVEVLYRYERLLASISKILRHTHVEVPFISRKTSGNINVKPCMDNKRNNQEV